MFKSIYMVNNPYIERLQCHLLISIQNLIFQSQFTTNPAYNTFVWLVQKQLTLHGLLQSSAFFYNIFSFLLDNLLISKNVCFPAFFKIAVKIGDISCKSFYPVKSQNQSANWPSSIHLKTFYSYFLPCSFKLRKLTKLLSFMARRETSATTPPVEGTLAFDDDTLRGWCEKISTSKISNYRMPYTV